MGDVCVCLPGAKQGRKSLDTYVVGTACVVEAWIRGTLVNLLLTVVACCRCWWWCVVAVDVFLLLMCC